MSILIFDWDDTLYPTTEYERIAHSEKVEEILETKFNEIGKDVISLLSSAQKAGLVYIVTNADKEWIITRCARDYKEVRPLLEKIEIRSARNLYSWMYPNEYPLWKYHVFIDILEKHANEKIHQIIHLGDMDSDRQAIRDAVADFRKRWTVEIRLKNIKLMLRPTLTTLRSELAHIISAMDVILTNPGNLDLWIYYQINCDPENEYGPREGQVEITLQDLGSTGRNEPETVIGLDTHRL